LEGEVKTQIRTQAIAIFVGLAVVSAVLLIAAASIADSFGKGVLVSFGSAVFASGLTFFLIRMTQTESEKHN
jgi:hypothetical protein